MKRLSFVLALSLCRIAASFADTDVTVFVSPPPVVPNDAIGICFYSGDSAISGVTIYINGTLFGTLDRYFKGSPVWAQPGTLIDLVGPGYYQIRVEYVYMRQRYHSDNTIHLTASKPAAFFSINGPVRYIH